MALSRRSKRILHLASFLSVPCNTKDDCVILTLMKTFFRISTFLLLALALAGCKTKAQKTLSAGEGNSFSDMEHKDSSIVDNNDSSPSQEIKEEPALFSYDLPELVSQCEQYLSQTQEEREQEAEVLTDMSEDNPTILLTQREFTDGDKATVVCKADMFLPDGTKTSLNPNDTVEIVKKLDDSLVEYDAYNPDSTEKYYTRYNYYLVHFKDKAGILGGSALAHGPLKLGSHWGSWAKTDTIRLYVNYKCIKYIYTGETEYFTDLYEYDLKTQSMRKLETGFVENEMHFEIEPLSLGHQKYSVSLSQFERFNLKGSDFYLCVLEYYPFPQNEDYSIYAIYAVREDGIAFSLGRFGGSQEECAEINSSYRLIMSESTGLPEQLEVYNYGYWSRNLENGEKEAPFTIKHPLKLDTDAMTYVEDGEAEVTDYLPDF